MLESPVQVLQLDGEWEVGPSRQYALAGSVPGVPLPADEPGEGTVWYRRQVMLPEGNWTHATLLLRGARWRPVVYVNGSEMGRAGGGMAPVEVGLSGPDVRPGRRVRLEVELEALQSLEVSDASWIAPGERWRTNVSACIWDSAILRLHGPLRIARLIPHYEIQKHELRVAWQVDQPGECRGKREMRLELLGEDGKPVRGVVCPAPDPGGEATLNLTGLETWSPSSPVCYVLHAVLLCDGRVMDEQQMTAGLRQLGVSGNRITINGAPVVLRGLVVAWHRWVRDENARGAAWDAAWFDRAFVQRLKSLGGNAIRFSGGMPPASWLDVCDRRGVLAKVEWAGSREIVASDASLREQWRCWLDELARHPCACVVRPWSDAPGADLQRAHAVLGELERELDPLIVCGRDTESIQKHWWGVSENVGLYRDALTEEPRPVIVDGFGGIGLDEHGDPGAHPGSVESLLRFLGREQDARARLAFQAEVGARMGEYWRRMGAAGFFLSGGLSSREDAGHLFLGEVLEGNPKPVWDAMYAAWAPVSLSVDTWDRNFEPGKGVTLPVQFVNQSDELVRMNATARVGHEDGYGRVTNQVALPCVSGADDVVEQFVTLRTPAVEGRFSFAAELDRAPEGLEWAITSMAPMRVFAIKSPRIGGLRAAVADEDVELRAMLEQNQIGRYEDLTNPRADMVIIGPGSRERFLGDSELRRKLWEGIEQGRCVLLLDAGPRWLGAEYPDDGPSTAPLERQRPGTKELELFGAVKLIFREMPEPESCIHPSESDESLWEKIPSDHTQLWNGLRGGLIVPAVDMEPVGLSPNSFLEVWKSRGARTDLIRGEHYFAYELSGLYAYSLFDDDQVQQALRARVRFVAEESPGSALTVDPNGPIRVMDLAEEYRRGLGARASRFVPLASAGKGLSRAPVVEIDFELGMGRVVISQLLTQGRLARGFGTPGRYGLRYDPVAVQFTLNMIRRCVLGR